MIAIGSVAPGKYRCSAISLLLISTSVYLHCQQFTRQEVGVGVLGQTASRWTDNAPSSIPDYVGPRHFFPGPFGRYTWNLSPSLALEGKVGYLPGFQTSYGVENGHELLALGGIKAGWRTKRFGIYGTMEPGIASYSPGLKVYVPFQQPFYQRRTNFALDYGGAFEWYSGRRTVVRLDVSQILISGFDQVLYRSGNGFFITNGHVAEHLGLSLSVAHRFGSIHDEVETEPLRRNVDVGILFSLQLREHLSEHQLQADQGGGAWVSWNLSRYFSLDGTAFYAPHKDGYAFPQDGGTTTNFLAGVKGGVRRDRLGYFAEVRPGMIQFSRTTFLDTPATYYWRKTTDFALNTGGVVEIYPSRHTILRAEGGNDFVYYQNADVHNLPSGQNTNYLPRNRSTILFLFGAGLRF